MNVTKEQEQAILNQARMAQAQAMEQAISKMTDRCFQVRPSQLFCTRKGNSLTTLSLMLSLCRSALVRREMV